MTTTKKTTTPINEKNLYYNFQYYTKPIIESSLLSSSSIAVSLAGSSSLADNNYYIDMPTTSTINNLLDKSYNNLHKLQQEWPTTDQNYDNLNEIIIINDDKNLYINNTNTNNKNPLNDNQIKRNDVHYLLKQLNSFSDIEEIEIIDINNKKLNDNISKQDEENELKLITDKQDQQQQNFLNNTIKQTITTAPSILQYCHHNQNKSIFEIELNTSGKIDNNIEYYGTGDSSRYAGDGNDGIDSNFYNNWGNYNLTSSSGSCSISRNYKKYNLTTNGINKYNNDKHLISSNNITQIFTPATSSTTTTTTTTTPNQQQYNEFIANEITKITTTNNSNGSNSCGTISNNKSLNSSISSSSYLDSHSYNSMINFNYYDKKYPTTILTTTASSSLTSTTIAKTNVVYSTTTRMAGDVIHTEINRLFDNNSDINSSYNQYKPSSTIVQQNINKKKSDNIIGTTKTIPINKTPNYKLKHSTASNSNNETKTSLFFKCCYTPLDRWRERRNDKNGGGGGGGDGNGGSSSGNSYIYTPSKTSNNTKNGDSV